MKKAFALLSLLFLAVPAFAHAGHVHTYMGTVTMLHSGTEFMIRSTDGKDVTIQTSSGTKFLHADGHLAKASELAVGNRVVVKVSNGKTADSVKMSAPKKK